MVVEHPELASVLKTAFESVWARGLTFDEAQGAAPTIAARSPAHGEPDTEVIDGSSRSQRCDPGRHSWR